MPGEYQKSYGNQIQQLEVEERQLADEIAKLKKQLEKIYKRKQKKLMKRIFLYGKII